MNINRRRLLQLGALLAASSGPSTIAAPLFSTEGVSLRDIEPGEDTVDFDGDYKALVCVFLYGGNDAWNLLVPIQNEGGAVAAGYGYQTYYQRRAALSVTQEALMMGGASIASAAENPYHSATPEKAYLKGVYPIANDTWGINGCAPELARLWHDNKLAWVVNTGVLATPVTRGLLRPSVSPAFLFAHNHQQRALATADAMGRVRYGWAGRLADEWTKANIIQKHLLGMNIAIGRRAPALDGHLSSALVHRAGKPSGFHGMNPDKLDQQRYAHVLSELNNLYRREMFGGLFKERQQKAMDVTELLGRAWDETHSFEHAVGPYGEPLFDMPDRRLIGLGGDLSNSLLQQLETVTKLIEIGKNQGLKRQVFMVGMGGFDTHSAQTGKHALLLRSLSLDLWKFQQALSALGLEDQVVTFTQSDFGRTLQNNGDGTDHGWGGHQLVMGGPIAARVHGDMPDLRRESQQMVDDDRGRVIPALAAEQTTAALMHWFGVSNALMPMLFPNLHHFQRNDSLSSSYLNLFS